jgi:hypothetical protein
MGRCEKQNLVQEKIMATQNEIREKITSTIIEALTEGGYSGDTHQY